MPNRTAVIAAAGPGLGAAVARRFAREGYDGTLLARHRERLEALAAEVTTIGHAAGGSAHAALPVDLLDRGALRDALAETPAPEVLVCNGGAWREADPLAVTPEQLAADLQLCVGAAHACVRAGHPAMAARGSGTILLRLL